MKLKKIITVAGLLTLSAIALVACSSQTSKQSSAKKDIIFATDGATAPFVYEKDGKLTGFDVEVAREVFKGSDKYKVDFKRIAWTSIFTGLDAGKYQMSGNNLSYSKQRAAKYLYSYPTATTPSVLTVAKNSDITSFDNIGGHVTQVVQGTSGATQIEEYNKEHKENPVKMKYSSADITQTLRSLNEGKIDFKIFDAPTVDTIIKTQGLTNLKTIELSSKEKPYIYFIFADGQKDLQKFVNKRIKELQANGKLAEISQEFLGSKSYIPTAEALKVPE